MIEKLFFEKLKFLKPKQNVRVFVEGEIEEVANKLLIMGYEVNTDRQKNIVLNSEGIELADYYEDLDWLLNLLNGIGISVNEKIELHNKLKNQLIEMEFLKKE